MMSRMLLLGVVVAVLSWQAEAKPEKCCMDNQYSVTLGDVGEVLTDDPSNVIFIDAAIRMGFDFYRDRVGTLSFNRQADGSVDRRYEVKDYTTRRVYNRLNNDTCTYSDLPDWDRMRSPCIPDDAFYMGPATFGYGQHSIDVYSWLFRWPVSSANESQVILSVTQDHCVPIAESIVGTYQGTLVEQSLFFTGYHPGLENVNLLEPPTGCRPATA